LDVLLRYIVITTARNESKTIISVIQSVAKQTILPEIHVIVDDNSTDNTSELSKKNGALVFQTNNPRIPFKGHNQVLGFISAIKHATKLVPNWDYVLKLDADSLIPSRYMEEIFKEFKKNPKLGIAAGIPYGVNKIQGRVTDGARVISRVCYEAIGGYHVRMAFDSQAVLLANQFGFETVCYVNIKYVELRPAKKYNVKAWILLGMERKMMYLPLYHTFLASMKNGLIGSPRILNFFLTFFGHLLYLPKKYDPLLSREWVRRYAIYEILGFIHGFIEKNDQK
jgi:glycosyltransferase involved in cell wall biosynthesis